MDDKKFLILLSLFGALSLILVLGLGAMVVLDTGAHKDGTNASYNRHSGAAPSERGLLKPRP